MEKKFNLVNLLLIFFLRYVRSAVLVFAILPIIFSIFLISTSINQTDLFTHIIYYLAKVNFISSDNLSGSDMMQIFFSLFLLFFIVMEIVNWLFGRLLHKKIIYRLKSKLLISSIVISIIYIIAIIILPFAPIDKNNLAFFYFFVIFCLLVSLVANCIFFVLNEFVSKIKFNNTVI